MKLQMKNQKSRSFDSVDSYDSSVDDYKWKERDEKTKKKEMAQIMNILR